MFLFAVLHLVSLLKQTLIRIIATILQEVNCITHCLTSNYFDELAGYVEFVCFNFKKVRF